jgi:hypothetical protein
MPELLNTRLDTAFIGSEGSGLLAVITSGQQTASVKARCPGRHQQGLAAINERDLLALVPPCTATVR